MNAQKKVKRVVDSAILNVLSTFNNTIITLSDLEGNVLCWASAGTAGFKGTRKGTPFAAQQASIQLLAKAKKFGVKQVEVKVRGPGQGKEPAVRVIHGGGIRILSIEDLTPIPHNGCRAPKKRKV
ncbi:MAG: 30S ribosomal protein S11 [Planctomycetes bacterium]|nr:30S ribosomal protein S11 [Planctomycetota bacterium]